MPVMEEISKLSKHGCDDALLDYICENHDESECELNGDEYKEPKKHNYDFCVYVSTILYTAGPCL